MAEPNWNVKCPFGLSSLIGAVTATLGAVLNVALNNLDSFEALDMIDLESVVKGGTELADVAPNTKGRSGMQRCW